MKKVWGCFDTMYERDRRTDTQTHGHRMMA